MLTRLITRASTVAAEIPLGSFITSTGTHVNKNDWHKNCDFPNMTS